MKFTKTALTLALVAASGSAMAEALKVGEGIIDGFNNVFAGSGYTLEKGGAGNVNLIKPDDTAVRLATLDKDTGYYSVDYDTVSQLKADGTAKMDTFLREHFGDDVIVTPVVPAPIGGVPVSREEAVQYVQDNGLLNLDGLEQAVKYRKNNENKYNLSENLTGEQKTSAINAVAEDEYLLVYNHAGEKALYNNTTGEYVTEADIADAKAAIVEEAQKRSDEKKLPIVGPKDL
ncbi:hypothetical protein JCM19232_3635 [Vibrio ishigakensis]|uniref:Uncharacterized protein n=1 Tax=Vibrio ishigakensis TaxID=1481914 RepID=A0A0B8PBV3_9VIBR|nr:hypothetical protein JCM19232_3635 [Vibrio ishigakensis]